MKDITEPNIYAKALADQNLREGLADLEKDFVKKIVLLSIVAAGSLIGFTHLFEFIDRTRSLEIYQYSILVVLFNLFLCCCAMIINRVSDFKRMCKQAFGVTQKINVFSIAVNLLKNNSSESPLGLNLGLKLVDSSEKLIVLFDFFTNKHVKKPYSTSIAVAIENFSNQPLNQKELNALISSLDAQPKSEREKIKLLSEYVVKDEHGGVQITNGNALRMRYKLDLLLNEAKRLQLLKSLINSVK